VTACLNFSRISFVTDSDHNSTDSKPTEGASAQIEPIKLADSDRSADSWRTTHWSVVLSAKRNGLDANDIPSTWKSSLELLCQTYWYPLYAYLRRKGYKADDCQDLVQDFFAALIEKDFLDSVEPEKGHFRWFLMSAIERFAANWTKAQGAAKRGGGRHVFSLDFDDGENRYSREPSDGWTAERLFDRRWALTLLDQAMANLSQSYERDGKKRYFDSLSMYLTADADAPSYAAAAEELGIAETTIKVAVFRMREKYRNVIRTLVAQTLDESEDLDAEIDQLLAAL